MTKKGKKLGAYKKTESSFVVRLTNLRSTVGNKQYYIAGNRVMCVDKTTNETTVLADFGTGISSYVDNFQVFHECEFWFAELKKNIFLRTKKWQEKDISI